MSQIEAVSFEEVECGKKIEGTKKRFRWKFCVGGTSYTLELSSSTLSGKRIVTLNNQEIHSEQSFFNFDFDFTHQIEGHTFRITRVPDTINTYEMRIDNQTFEQIKERTKFGIKEQKDSSSNAYRKVENDPFSDFGAFAKQSKPITTNNQFGQFDFDAFSKPAPAQKIQTANSAPIQPLKKKEAKSNNSFQDFDFSKLTPNSYEEVNFQTNVQAEKKEDNVNFFQNFNKYNNETAHDDDAFATGIYSKNSMYSDLVYQRPEQKSDWSDFGTEKEEPKSAGFKIEMRAKQVFNKVKMTAEELKMKLSGQDQSLI